MDVSHPTEKGKSFSPFLTRTYFSDHRNDRDCFYKIGREREEMDNF